MGEELKKLEELLANDRKIIEDNYKEIERLKKRLEESQLAFLQVDKDKQRIHSIIKEAKKYIEEHIEWEVDGEEGIDYTAWINFKGTSYEYFVKELLEILDKENI